MAECERLKTCSFYQNRMIIETGFGEVLKKRFCECNNTANCARFMVLKQLGPEYLDDSLFPTMIDRAMELIARNKEAVAVENM